MGIVVDAEKALELLDQCVEERGTDYCYPGKGDEGCRYWHKEDNAPGCIVGLVFHKLGLPASCFADRDENHAGCATAVRFLRDEQGLIGPDKEVEKITPRAIGVLSSAQSMQDSGHPWERVVKHVKRRSETDEYEGYPDE